MIACLCMSMHVISMSDPDDTVESCSDLGGTMLTVEGWLEFFNAVKDFFLPCPSYNVKQR